MLKNLTKTPKKALPIDIAHWYQNQEFVDNVRQIMQNEAFLTAIAVLKDAAGPTASSLTSDTTKNSNLLSWYAGYCDAFKDLAKLAKTPHNNKPTIDEWMHL